MRATKTSPTTRRSIQPRPGSPTKRRSPKTASNTPKYTHFFCVLRNAKQLHQLTSRFLTATVRVHPNLGTLSSSPVLCHHSQADFQFAFSIDLSGSNVTDSPELFSPKITISTNDNDHRENVATAAVVPSKSKVTQVNGRSLAYLANHQDIPLKLISSPKIGGFINITCAFGSADHKQAIEPSLDFINTSIKYLQRITPEKPSSDLWENDAIENGWVPPDKAAEIWQKIALEHGWSAPQKPKMVMHFSSIGDCSPTVPDNTDLISFSSDDNDINNNDDDINDNDNNNNNKEKDIESDKNKNKNRNRNKENTDLEIVKEDHENAVCEKKDDLEKNGGQKTENFEDKVEPFVNFALASKYSIQTEDVFNQKPKLFDFSNRFTVFEMQPEWQPADSDTDLNRDLTNLLAESKKSKTKRKLRSLQPSYNNT